MAFLPFVVHAQTTQTAAESPQIDNCPIFPADNVWNTPVDTLSKDPKSETYIESIGALKKLHADFGPSPLSGIPFAEVPPDTKRVEVAFDYRGESDLGAYPIPPDAPIEAGPDGKGDRHILLIDPQRCILYELFLVKPHPDGSWSAGSGVQMDLTSNALRGLNKTSADAAGLPILPGLVRYDEVASGEIKHALRFTIPNTQRGFVWPARHMASINPDPHLTPMGERFRLRADFDISTYSKTNQVILTALKRYGMILADNGAAVFISGAPDKRWDNDDLHKLGAITAKDFEAVDESVWQILPDSARVDPLAVVR